MGWRRQAAPALFAVIVALLFVSPGVAMFRGRWVQVSDLLAVAYIIFLTYRLATKRLRWQSAFDAPLFMWAYLGACAFFSVVSLVYFLAGEIQLVWFLMPVKMMLMFSFVQLVLDLLRTERVNPRQVAVTFFAVSVVQILYMVFQVATQQFSGYYLVDIVGSIGPSHAGFTAAILVCFAAYYWAEVNRTLPYLALTALLILDLFLIINRISIVAVVVVLCLWGLVEYSRRMTWKRMLIAWGLVSLLVGLGIVLSSTDPVSISMSLLGRYDPHNSMNRIFDFFHAGASGSANERVHKWGEHLRALHDLDLFHVIFGAGSYAQAIYIDSVGKLVPTGAGVDNLVVKILWNFGYAGFAMFLPYFFAHAAYTVRNRRNILGVFIFFVMAIHNVTHELYFVGKTLDIFMLMTAITIWMNEHDCAPGRLRSARRSA